MCENKFITIIGLSYIQVEDKLKLDLIFNRSQLILPALPGSFFLISPLLSY